MRLAPTIQEERLRVLRSRVGAWKAASIISPENERLLMESTRTRWTASSLIPRAIYFILTLVCVAAVYGLVELVGLPEKIVCAAICLITAEALILRFGLFRAGPDEALYLAGLLFVVTGIRGPGMYGEILLIGIALIVAGARLRNGLYLAGSIAAMIIYITATFDAREAGAFLSLGAAFAGVALLNRRWNHPVWSSFFSWVILGMPLLAYLIVTVEGATPRIPVIVAGTSVATLLLFAGMFIRHHAPLASGLIVSAIVIYEAGRLMTLLLEYRLMLAGALTGIAVLALHRAFRDRASGITSERILDTQSAALLEPLAAAALGASQPASDRTPGLEGGGGRYGGGGASGEF